MAWKFILKKDESENKREKITDEDIEKKLLNIVELIKKELQGLWKILNYWLGLILEEFFAAKLTMGLIYQRTDCCDSK